VGRSVCRAAIRAAASGASHGQVRPEHVLVAQLRQKNFFPHVLTKPFRDQQLLEAVQEAINRYRTMRLQRADLTELRWAYESLTPSEREVMPLVVTGCPTSRSPPSSAPSEANVEAHGAQLMQKMRVKSIPLLVRIAGRLGLLPSPH